MSQEIITASSTQTQKLGQTLAEQLCDGSASWRIICLSGDLGSGKTTFTQGLLKGLKIKGPYTSPTFSIIKHYRKEFPISIRQLADQFPKKIKIQNSKFKILNIYHIDAYRINTKDLFELGWQDFAGKPNTVTIVEWPEKIKRLIPTSAVWINFEWLDEKQRKITFKNFKLK